LFRSAGRVYQAKKRYFALKQLYHFVPPGSQRIAATTSASGLTVSAFRSAEANSIVLVGVKEGGPGHIRVTLPKQGPAPAAWELYETTRLVNCAKVDSVSVRDGDAEIDLPDQAVFTLVGTLPKPEKALP